MWEILPNISSSQKIRKFPWENIFFFQNFLKKLFWQTLVGNFTEIFKILPISLKKKIPLIDKSPFLTEKSVFSNFGGSLHSLKPQPPCQLDTDPSKNHKKIIISLFPAPLPPTRLSSRATPFYFLVFPPFWGFFLRFLVYFSSKLLPHSTHNGKLFRRLFFEFFSFRLLCVDISQIRITLGDLKAFSPFQASLITFRTFYEKKNRLKLKQRKTLAHLRLFCLVRKKFQKTEIKNTNFLLFCVGVGLVSTNYKVKIKSVFRTERLLYGWNIENYLCVETERERGRRRKLLHKTERKCREYLEWKAAEESECYSNQHTETFCVRAVF